MSQAYKFVSQGSHTRGRLCVAEPEKLRSEFCDLYVCAVNACVWQKQGACGHSSVAWVCRQIHVCCGWGHSRDCTHTHVCCINKDPVATVTVFCVGVSANTL